MRRTTTVAFAFGVLLTGCPKGGRGTGLVPADLQAWAPPPAAVEYTVVNRAGPLPLPNRRILDEWVGPTLSGKLVVYDVSSTDISEKYRVIVDGVEQELHAMEPEHLTTVRHFYGAQGYGYLATVEDDGTVEAWDPPQIVMPPAPKVGDSWSESHRKGDETSTRSCEIVASEFCDEGLVVICDSQREGTRTVLRDHFCKGVGWSGFEAMRIVPDTPAAIRMWSTEVTRDGVRLPEPPATE